MLSFFCALLLSLRLILAIKLSKEPQAQEVVFYIHGWQGFSSLPENFHMASQYNQKREPIVLKDAFASLGKSYYPLSWQKWAFDRQVDLVQRNIWAEGPIEQLVEDYCAYPPHHSRRIVSHSLGTQVALRLAYHIVNKYPHKPDLWPSRIALLDPVFLPGCVSPKIPSLREHCLDLIKKLQKYNIVFECYRSSLMSRHPFPGLSTDPFKNLMTSVDLYPNHLPPHDIISRHSEVKNFYFSSLLLPAKVRCFSLSGEISFLKYPQGASTSLEDTRKNKDFHFSQLSSSQGEILFQIHKKK